MSSIARREVYYSGNVQGVGFRYTTRSIAQGFDVTGYVENLPDGRVHLEVEGSPDAVREFLSAVASEMSGNIRTQNATELPATGEFTSFTVRR
jgi:acylphosphatase